MVQTKEEKRRKSRIYEQKPERKARKKITDKLYRQANKERISKRQKAYRQRPEIKERDRKHAQKPEIMNKKNASSRKNRKSKKIRVLTEYSKRISGADHPMCACCGEDFHEIFLSIDHIKPISKSKTEKRGIGIYGRLERTGFPEGYQVLCMNCNMAKGTAKKCPHQRNR